MATKGQLISDVELRLSKGVVSDDFQVDRRQIAFWIDSIRSQLIKEKENASQMEELADFVQLYECIDIGERPVDCSTDCDRVKYEVELPVSVQELRGDLGVYRVETESGNTIYRIRPSEKARIRHLKFAFPNKFRSVWYRLSNPNKKNVLVIEGGTDNFRENGKVNLYLIPEDTSALSDEDDYPIDASLVAMLLDRAEAIGRREIGLPEDLENDGKQQ